MARNIAGIGTGTASFAGQTEEELESLSAPDLLLRFLRGASPLARLWRELAERGRELKEAQKEAARRGFPHRQVIGAVLEGESLAHVVYRTVLESDQAAESGRPFASPQVTVVRRTDRGWRLASADALLGPTMFSVTDVRVTPSGDAPAERAGTMEPGT